MKRTPCPACGHVHTSNDARAIGRFTGSPTFVAANASTPARKSRTEAEADECRWRQERAA